MKDDWLANKMLRDAFRATKKERKAQLAKDKLITGKCGLELDLVPEEDEDVRMARLLNGLSKTDADQRRQEEVGDIKNNDIFAKGAAAEKDAKSNRADKKLLALKTIGKATKGKQSEILSRKGFGLVVAKVKEKNKEILSDIATTSKPATIASEKKSAVSQATYSTDSSASEKPSLEHVPAEKTSNNSLSMLLSQYDASSDSD